MSVRRRSITSRLARDLNREIGSHEFTRGMFEARGKALDLADKQIWQLRQELSLAEEGLANYAQELEELKGAVEEWKDGMDCAMKEVERLRAALRGIMLLDPENHTRMRIMACEALGSREPQSVTTTGEKP